MKKLLTLVLCWLIAFSAMAETTLKAKTALSAAGGYITSLNKVDGSFEDGTAGWVASTDTIVQTASTEFQGNYKGTWTATGTGTLDLQWTATASNTYEASAQVNVNGEDDMYICAYVGTTETGCKLIPALNKIQKVSVVADSVLGSAFHLRLKHTGSDAFSIDTDDGKIEPWTPQAVNLAKREFFDAYGNAANSITAQSTDIPFNTVSTSSLSGLGTWTSSTTYTAKEKHQVCIYAKATFTTTASRVLEIYRNGQRAYLNGAPSSADGVDISKCVELVGGEYITVREVLAGGTLINLPAHHITITANAISDNVVQSYQPSDLLGELRFLPQNIAPKGFIPALGSSIGKSAGTYQGDAYYDLYKVLWTQSSVTAGEPYVISSAKGTDAATDWAANKTITIDVSGLVVRAYKSGTTAAVGAKQADALQGHGHGLYSRIYNNYPTAADGSSVGGDTFAFNDTSGTASPNADFVAKGLVDIGYSTPRFDYETRMTNIAQYAFIRYGNDAPTLLALPAATQTEYYIEAAGNAGQAITAEVTDIPFIATTQNNLTWDGSGFTAPISGNYEIFGSVYYTTTPSNLIRLFVNNAHIKNLSTLTANGVTSTYYFSGKVYLTAGQRLSFRASGGGTLINDAKYHNLTITRLNGKNGGVLISNLNPDGFNRTLGTVGLIDNFSFSYGTTNATTVCSASPCSYLDQIGNYVTSVTRISTGQYTVNFGKTFTKLKCNSNVYQAAATGSKQAPPIRCENCSSISFETNIPQVAYYDTYGTLVCQGY